MRYDMKLLVVDHIPELFSAPARSISAYRGEAVIETAFFLMEDEKADSVFDKVMDVIKASIPITKVSFSPQRGQIEINWPLSPTRIWTPEEYKLWKELAVCMWFWMRQ